MTPKQSHPIFAATTAILVTLILAFVPPVVSACSDNRPTYALSRPSPFDATDVSLRPTPSSQELPTERADTTEDTTYGVAYETLVVPQATVVALSDAECISYIIAHESHGDPWAENGKYKGIGQLDESYYPRYIGRTWAEVAGDYDAQFEAMTAYVMSRYGSWQAAYAHAVETGWY
jgi:hypothetical protein